MKAVVTIGALAATLGLAAGASGSPNRPSGALQLRASFTPTWQFGDYCPPGSPRTLECVRFIGTGQVAGLGKATGTYTKTLGEDNGCDVTQFRTAAISVEGKGEIRLSLPGTVCGRTAPAETGPLDVTITGGSGLYAGASGTVVFRSSVYAGDFACRCGRASDTWSGTVTVPGLDFDVAAPALKGAVAKRVRAPRNVKRVRVHYAVTAHDAVDGSVPAVCRPRSGVLFKLGRTRVTCSATDSSGNTGTARFTVTVNRR